LAKSYIESFGKEINKKTSHSYENKWYKNCSIHKQRKPYKFLKFVMIMPIDANKQNEST